MMVTTSSIRMITPPYIQYMRIRIRMAAPHIRQNFHNSNVRSRPRDSAELNPMWRSEGSTVGIAVTKGGKVTADEKLITPF